MGLDTQETEANFSAAGADDTSVFGFSGVSSDRRYEANAAGARSYSLRGARR
jgi:hypothetical protein